MMYRLRSTCSVDGATGLPVLRIVSTPVTWAMLILGAFADRGRFIQIVPRGGIDRLLIGAGDDAALIVEQDDQIGAERLAPLLELIGNADQIDDRRGGRRAGIRRRSGSSRHRFLNVGYEL